MHIKSFTHFHTTYACYKNNKPTKYLTQLLLFIIMSVMCLIKKDGTLQTICYKFLGMKIRQAPFGDTLFKTVLDPVCCNSIIYNSPFAANLGYRLEKQCSIAPSLLYLVWTSTMPVHTSTQVQIHFHLRPRSVPWIFHFITHPFPRGIYKDFAIIINLLINQLTNYGVLVVQWLAHVPFTSARDPGSIPAQCSYQIKIPPSTVFSGFSGFLLYKYWINKGWPLLDL